jgi:hypothetical protein
MCRRDAPPQHPSEGNRGHISDDNCLFVFGRNGWTGVCWRFYVVVADNTGGDGAFVICHVIEEGQAPPQGLSLRRLSRSKSLPFPIRYVLDGFAICYRRGHVVRSFRLRPYMAPRLIWRRDELPL